MSLVRKRTVRPDGLSVAFEVDKRATHIVWTLYRPHGADRYAWTVYCEAWSENGARRSATAKALAAGGRAISELEDIA